MRFSASGEVPFPSPVFSLSPEGEEEGEGEGEEPFLAISCSLDELWLSHRFSAPRFPDSARSFRYASCSLRTSSILLLASLPTLTTTSKHGKTSGQSFFIRFGEI